MTMSYNATKVKTTICLHDYPDGQFITKSELAAALARTERTILRMVRRYELPPPVRLGKRAVWQVGHVKKWISDLSERQINSTKSEIKRLNIDFN